MSGDGPNEHGGSALVLGPLMRYVDETSAAIWVETRSAATVTVAAGEQRWTARTFRVHEHHYALVECVGLEAGSVTPYSVAVGDEHVWPVPGRLQLPPPVISTLKPGKPLRLAFGSCRTSVPHDRGPLPRRPGLRRRDHRADAAVHRVAA